MSAIKLREGIWSVGILNPALRVFDIVMESKYGTSYNAYLLTGEKNVLIETVHLDYWDEFVSNVEEVLPLEQVDYLIMNHTEPDHSGSVARLLERCPNLTVLCTTSAKKFLTAIANRALPCRVVKDGDTLDLGNKVLHFLTAPLLHWPDSMFTWDPADRTLFTCDFLGAHFCEPTMKDTGIHPVYRNAYEGELRYYFDCIFGPFKPSVLAGLDKMPAEAELVCPSHGPVLTETLAHAKERYRAWSTPAPKSGPTAAVLYCSAYGCTQALAEAAARALADEGCPVTAAGLDAINTMGRAAGAFGSFGWTGEAADMLQAQLAQLKFKTLEKPFKVCFRPTEADLAAVADYARAVAALTAPAKPAAPKAQKYVCSICGYIYDPEQGDAKGGVAPGTPFESLPADWVCPLCRMGREMFKPAP